MEKTFDPDVIHAIFKFVWSRRAAEREKHGVEILEGGEMCTAEIELGVLPALFVYSLLLQQGAGTSKRNRPTSANGNAVKLSCELLRLLVTEAVQRASIIAEAEGGSRIEATHLERILPQLLLDF